MHYSREATANRTPRQPMIFTAPGRFESASVTPVAENVEVVAAAGGDRGHSDGDASSRADRKRKPRGKLKLGPVKLVRGGGLVRQLQRCICQ